MEEQRCKEHASDTQGKENKCNSYRDVVQVMPEANDRTFIGSFDSIVTYESNFEHKRHDILHHIQNNVIREVKSQFAPD
jgi:hypothetical protein